MDMNTAASVITYISRLERESAKLYDEWAEVHEKLREPFAGFARENKKNEQRVKRAYYGVVSDALETAFCFKELRSDIILPEVGKETTITEVLDLAVRLENGIKSFYEEAARLSKALLPDVPREMQKVAFARESRIRDLLAISEAERAVERR